MRLHGLLIEDIAGLSPLKLTHVVTSHAGAYVNSPQYQARLENVREYVSHTDLQLLNKGMSHQQIHVMRKYPGHRQEQFFVHTGLATGVFFCGATV